MRKKTFLCAYFCVNFISEYYVASNISPQYFPPANKTEKIAQREQPQAILTERLDLINPLNRRIPLPVHASTVQNCLWTVPSGPAM